MLDAFKGFTGGKTQKQFDDLQTLIATAREERGALSAMLTQVSMRSGKLSQVGKSLDRIDEKAGAAASRLAELQPRISKSSDPEDLPAISRQQREAFYRCG